MVKIKQYFLCGPIPIGKIHCCQLHFFLHEIWHKWRWVDLLSATMPLWAFNLVQTIFILSIHFWNGSSELWWELLVLHKHFWCTSCHCYILMRSCRFWASVCSNPQKIQRTVLSKNVTFIVILCADTLSGISLFCGNQNGWFRGLRWEKNLVCRKYVVNETDIVPASPEHHTWCNFLWYPPNGH